MLQLNNNGKIQRTKNQFFYYFITYFGLSLLKKDPCKIPAGKAIKEQETF